MVHSKQNNYRNRKKFSFVYFFSLEIWFFNAKSNLSRLLAAGTYIKVKNWLWVTCRIYFYNSTYNVEVPQKCDRFTCGIALRSFKTNLKFLGSCVVKFRDARDSRKVQFPCEIRYAIHPSRRGKSIYLYCFCEYTFTA